MTEVPLHHKKRRKREHSIEKHATRTTAPRDKLSKKSKKSITSECRVTENRTDTLSRKPSDMKDVAMRDSEMKQRNQTCDTRVMVKYRSSCSKKKKKKCSKVCEENVCPVTMETNRHVAQCKSAICSSKKTRLHKKKKSKKNMLSANADLMLHLDRSENLIASQDNASDGNGSQEKNYQILLNNEQLERSSSQNREIDVIEEPVVNHCKNVRERCDNNGRRKPISLKKSIDELVGAARPALKKRYSHGIELAIKLAEKARQSLLDTDLEKCSVDNIELIIHPKQLGIRAIASSKYTDELLKIGIKLKSGIWSSTESEQLHKNFYKFAADYNVQDPYRLFSPRNYEDCKWLKSIVKDHCFYQRLAFGIRRTVYTCYHRAKYTFHPDTSLKLDEDQVKRFKELFQIHGRQWAKIGKALGKYGKSLLNYYTYHLNDEHLVKGHWSKEEQQQLIHAIQTEVHTTDIAGLFHGLPWSRISEHVPTRNWKQCMIKWLSIMSFNKSHERKPRSWTHKDKVKLIKCLYHLDVDADCDVDWDSIYMKFDNVPSPQALRVKWCSLRASVPDYHIKAFDEICEHLYLHKIPELKKKIKKAKKNKKAQPTGDIAA